MFFEKCLVIWMLFVPVFSFAQDVTDEEIGKRIAVYKSDIRGPYKEIRWYCPDGSIIPPKERCPEPGGVQRARAKDEVLRLADARHIFLGQILAATPFDAFWDTAQHASRLKQYQLEKYLKTIDNGWILRKAQYYRGAYQNEDEEQWGLSFYHWLLADQNVLANHFFLIRESLKDVPHAGDNNLKQQIRLLSKEIADAYEPFTDIRVKIHGQPDATDIKRVKEFREKHKALVASEVLAKMDELLLAMEKQYQPFQIQSINTYLAQLPAEAPIAGKLREFQKSYATSQNILQKVRELSVMLYAIRTSVTQVDHPKARLALLDISIILEYVLFKELAGFSPGNLQAQFDALYFLGQASVGCGYLQVWEWNALIASLQKEGQNDVTQAELVKRFEACRSLTEWGVGMFSATYEETVHLFAGFEPLAQGFVDEKVRASLLLQVGLLVERLAQDMARVMPTRNYLMELSGAASARGLNPGYTKGELVVVSGNAEKMLLDKNKIYVFHKPPSDLKPVAGIATVSEGNPVSHIQLLARNLGIPNAVIPLQTLEELKKHSGQSVFYAVSTKGVIVMKPEQQMTAEERALFERKTRDEKKIAVPTQKINLNEKSVLNMRKVNAASSGIVCGPKAANLGQLKQLFPDNVVEGLVIPFGIFREHLNQQMPGTTVSYWQYLNSLYAEAARLYQQGAPEAQVEQYMLKELKVVHQAIKQIPLSAAFIADLRNMFQTVFKTDMGTIAVFLRSDTNMEDLKEFTGAGLNLTLFNVVQEELIWQGIRDVWASPFTERSYKWRQRYLTNPENVFPSILIIPSVNVDYSGVVVTKGVSNGAVNDITLAFSLGAGGAVDGQAAEAYLLKQDGTQVLLSPAREATYVKLPPTGGTEKHFATLKDPIVNPQNLAEIRKLVQTVKQQLPDTPGIETQGPFDMELGFLANKLYLFQVRPFVENKNANSQLYLESLNPVLSDQKRINLLQPLEK